MERENRGQPDGTIRHSYARRPWILRTWQCMLHYPHLQSRLHLTYDHRKREFFELFQGKADISSSKVPDIYGCSGPVEAFDSVLSME